MKLWIFAAAFAIVALLYVQRIPKETTLAEKEHGGVMSASGVPAKQAPPAADLKKLFASMADISVGDCVKRVIVVGGGAAGLAAAVEAVAAGEQAGIAVCVSLIDKEKNVGGNSAKASSGINAAGTHHQQKEGIDDTPALFAADTIKSGGGQSDASLVEVLASESAPAINFLEDFGLDMSLLTQCGGHTRKRTHRPVQDPAKKPTNTGMAIIAALQSQLEIAKTKGRFQLLTNSRVVSLLTDSSSKKTVVVGVKVQKQPAGAAGGGPSLTMMEEEDVLADAVILATGGFSASPELLARFAPHLSHLPTTNGPFATGDGLKLGEEVGAAITQIDNIQVHPTGFIDPQDIQAHVKWLAPEALRAAGGLLLGSGGKRFVNELGYRDEVTQAIFAHGEQTFHADGRKGCIVATLVLNDAASKIFPLPPIYKMKGFVKTAENAADLARQLGVDAAAVLEAFETYERGRQEGKDVFGKTVFPVSFSASEPLSFMAITPSLHYTMGGLKINAQAAVLSQDERQIPGLFACGEVTGGVHGKNRLAGNGLLDNLVFGRRAGRGAVASFLP